MRGHLVPVALAMTAFATGAVAADLPRKGPPPVSAEALGYDGPGRISA